MNDGHSKPLITVLLEQRVCGVVVMVVYVVVIDVGEILIYREGGGGARNVPPC